MKAELNKPLFDKIRLLLEERKGEVLYGDTHVIDVSEEEYVDKFNDVHYRVYHSSGKVFDIVQAYSSEAYGGGGGPVYEYYSQVFEDEKETTIEEAHTIIDSLFGQAQIWRYEFKAPTSKGYDKELED